MDKFPDHAQLANIALIEELYGKYLKDPESVDISWRHFFEGIDFGSHLFQKMAPPSTIKSDVRIAELIAAYRKFGHLQAHFNPLEDVVEEVAQLQLENLSFVQSELDEEFPTLGFCGKEKAPLREIIQALKQIYCNQIGFEYVDTENVELQKWIQAQIEPKLILDPSIEENTFF